MNCSHCGGWMMDKGDGLGETCLMCGRSPEPPPTAAQLRAAGVNLDTHGGHEVEGLHRQGMEYNPAPFKLPGRYHADSRYERGT